MNNTEDVAVSRRYEAKPEFVRATPILAKTPAQVTALPGYPYLLRVNVDPKKPYRKVWAWLYNDDSAAFFLDYDLVCSNNGEETYRQKLIHASQGFGNVAGEWTSNLCFFPVGGMFVEGVTTFIGTLQVAIMPVVLNVTCDTIYLQVNTITGGLSHNGNLMVRSETGI